MIERIEPYLSEAVLAGRIAELGAEISQDYADRDPVIFICVLKGSILFFSDLIRQVQIPTNLAFLGVSSYEGGTKSSGAVRLTHDITVDIAGRDVILVEDIVDTGLTMQYLLENLSARKPNSLKVCSLLYKPARQKIQVPIDYMGFEIEDCFVVGYGLDYEQRYRDLPFIGVMHFDP